MTNKPPATMTHLALAEVISRIAAHPAVDGLLTIGSTSRAELTPASDYDLVVVLGQAPVSIRVALTYIDQRLSDIIFVLTREVQGLLGEEPAASTAQWAEAQLRRWLRTGRVEFDRTGLLERAQTAARSAPEPVIGTSERYAAAFSINYNVRQTRRMLLSDDPAYQLAVDARLLFSLHDLWRYYFVLRELPVWGEKDQARYLLKHDPGYLQAFHQCLAQTDRQAKFNTYAALAAQTLVPAGGLCAEDVSGLLPNPDEPWAADTLDRAQSFWNDLVQGPGSVPDEGLPKFGAGE